MSQEYQDSATRGFVVILERVFDEACRGIAEETLEKFDDLRRLAERKGATPHGAAVQAMVGLRLAMRNGLETWLTESRAMLTEQLDEDTMLDFEPHVDAAARAAYDRMSERVFAEASRRTEHVMDWGAGGRDSVKGRKLSPLPRGPQTADKFVAVYEAVLDVACDGMRSDILAAHEQACELTQRRLGLTPHETALYLVRELATQLDEKAVTRLIRGSRLEMADAYEEALTLGIVAKIAEIDDRRIRATVAEALAEAARRAEALRPATGAVQQRLT